MFNNNYNDTQKKSNISNTKNIQHLPIVNKSDKLNNLNKQNLSDFLDEQILTEILNIPNVPFIHLINVTHVLFFMDYLITLINNNPIIEIEYNIEHTCCSIHLNLILYNQKENDFAMNLYNKFSKEYYHKGMEIISLKINNKRVNFPSKYNCGGYYIPCNHNYDIYLTKYKNKKKIMSNKK